MLWSKCGSRHHYEAHDSGVLTSIQRVCTHQTRRLFRPQMATSLCKRKWFLILILCCLLLSVFNVLLFADIFAECDHCTVCTEVHLDELQWNDPNDPSLSPPFDIDIVISWAGPRNRNDRRSRETGELRYCLRSIYEHIPWFHTIFLLVNPTTKISILNGTTFIKESAVSMPLNRVRTWLESTRFSGINRMRWISITLKPSSRISITFPLCPHFTFISTTISLSEGIFIGDSFLRNNLIDRTNGDWFRESLIMFSVHIDIDGNLCRFLVQSQRHWKKRRFRIKPESIWSAATSSIFRERITNRIGFSLKRNILHFSNLSNRWNRDGKIVRMWCYQWIESGFIAGWMEI